MNRYQTVFGTVIATLIFLIGVAQGLALGANHDLLPISGIIGGLIPFVCGVFSTILFAWVLSGPGEANVGQEDTLEIERT